MGKAETYIALLERLQSGNLTVDTRRCVVARNRNAGCRRCAQACTSGCITLDGNELSVQADRCIGCGSCATACPTGALQARRPDDRELVAAARRCSDENDGRVVFACAVMMDAAGDLIDDAKVVRVTCLGRIDESLICLLAAAGARDVRLVAGECADCDLCSGRAVADRVVESMDAIARAWNVPASVGLTSTFPRRVRSGAEHEYDHARRDALLGMRNDARAAADTAIGLGVERIFDEEPIGAVHYTQVSADGTLPHVVPTRRRLLLDALGRMGTPADEMVECRLWGHVVVDAAACTSCRMCAVFCPTGALTVDETDSRVRLVHAPVACVKCRCCEDVCLLGALELSESVFARDIDSCACEVLDLDAARGGRGGPDSIRDSLAKMIDSPYVTG